MIKDVIEKVKKGENLSDKETEATFTEIMGGFVDAETIAAFLTVLREKGETVEEITGAARVMRKFAERINVENANLVDTCGTGGDNADTFNVSTVSAFVAAGAGARVAKHGNRAVSSKCGSADLLAELGVNIDAEKDVVEKCIDTIGIGFLFAPKFHLAMKYASPARKIVKSRTIFNILGPLTNPAKAPRQLIGVYSGDLIETMAGVLRNLGSERAFVVWGEDGLDEITTAAETRAAELKNNNIKTYKIKPEEFGIKRSEKKDLKGGDCLLNAKIAMEILGGKKGPKRDIVLLNAGATVYIAGLAKDLQEGIKKAAESIDSGRALEKLEQLKDFTNK